MIRKGKGCLTGLVGAILIHPALFVLVFAWGAVFGTQALVSGGPPGPRLYGVEGGLTALIILALYYVFLIPPLGISILGGVVGIGLGEFFRAKSTDKNSDEPLEGPEEKKKEEDGM